MSTLLCISAFLILTLGLFTPGWFFVQVVDNTNKEIYYHLGLWVSRVCIDEGCHTLGTIDIMKQRKFLAVLGNTIPVKYTSFGTVYIVPMRNQYPKCAYCSYLYVYQILKLCIQPKVASQATEVSRDVRNSKVLQVQEILVSTLEHQVPKLNRTRCPIWCPVACTSDPVFE